MKLKVTRLLRSNLAEEAKTFLSLFNVSTNELPEEQDIWIDTDKINEIDDILPGELSANSFVIYMDGRQQPLYIKNEYFDVLINNWKNN